MRQKNCCETRDWHDEKMSATGISNVLLRTFLRTNLHVMNNFINIRCHLRNGKICVHNMQLKKLVIKYVCYLKNKWLIFG